MGRALRTVLGLAVATGVLAAAQPASAVECGKRQNRLPDGAAAGSVPLVVGDSVLYDAAGSVAGRGFEANAMICRTMAQGLRILRTRAAAQTLPDLVVLELGANGVVTRADISTALRILGDTRSLVLLTPTDDDPPRGVDAKTMRAAAKAQPDRIRVIDWAGRTKRHPSWMASDGVHLGGAKGVAALTDAIAEARPATAETPTTTPTTPAPTTAGTGNATGGLSPSS
jgi:hypothetical protein